MPKQFNHGEVVGCLVSGQDGNAQTMPEESIRIPTTRGARIRFMEEVYNGMSGMDRLRVGAHHRE